MALDAKTSITHPLQINLTAGSDSSVALLIGAGSPDGNVDPWNSALKSSAHIRIDATDDYPTLYLKVDADGADDDWVPVIVEKSEMDHILEGHLTLDADKRLFLRDTNTSIYSDAACKIFVDSAKGMDVTKFSVGSGTFVDSFLAGSGTIVYGALAACAASTASLAITGLTQEHKIFISPSSMSGCLNITGIACSPGGGLLALTVNVVAVETYAGGNLVFGYTAFAACGP